MSDSEGPKKETVRITLPPRVRPGESRGTVRINMPSKPVANGNAAQSPPRPPPPGSPARLDFVPPPSARFAAQPERSCRPQRFAHHHHHLLLARLRLWLQFRQRSCRLPSCL